MRLLLTLLCSAICLTSLAHERGIGKETADHVNLQSDTTVYEFTKVQVMPKFKGGMQKFHAELKSKLEYPKEAEKAGIKGRVFLSFIVELDGDISNIKVMRKLGHGCDEAAVSAIRKLSFEAPAYHNGKPVRMSLNMPVGFGV